MLETREQLGKLTPEPERTWRGPQAMTLSNEEGVIEHRSQASQALADGRLRKVQTARGPRDAAFFQKHLQHLQEIEVQARIEGAG
ncbi:hypothetical protein HHA02_14860 [Cobetia marina]|nr:hypothetical protein HHA02_14860 [Cobetia marina]